VITFKKYYRALAQNPIISYRIESILWLTILALVILFPFSVNNFIQERYLLGYGSLLVIGILLLQGWTIHRGRYTPIITTVGLVPAIILFLALAFERQGMIGALWCYPSVLVFYFILPRRQAIFASICLLIMAIPHAWFYLEPSLAIRVAATLIAVTSFSAIFVVIIERQQQELEKKETQRRDSMASASHELRTPLATLLAQIEAMRDGIRPLDKKHLASLSNSVEHMTDLVNDLYLLSLSDVSALVCDKEPQYLDQIVNTAIDAARSKLADHNLSIASTIKTPVCVIGDARRLRQIIDNLLENCYRYIRPDDEITVTLNKQKSWAELVVTDTGPGVNEDEMSMLFERFYRADKSRSRQHGGTGLGLSLVKALVDVHGGQVRAFKASSGGLGVSIKLPIHNQQDGKT
jgi:signal transduction histidine kinase